MARYRTSVLALVTVIMTMLIVIGCQNNNQSPVVPGTSGDTGLTGYNQTGSDNRDVQYSNCRSIWGLWSVEIDPVTYQAEIIPLRGSEWHANVVEFMQPPYNPANLGILVDVPASDPATGFFAVDIVLRHPFPGLNQFTGFDVKGIFLADGSYQSSHDEDGYFANPDPGIGEARLLNADGYTRWFNPMEFTLGGIPILEYIHGRMGTNDNTTATLNPYRYFSDEFASPSMTEIPIQEVEMDPELRGSFSPGMTITRRYDIQFAMVGGKPLFSFTYAIDASYYDPDEGDPTYPLESFPISANMHECYKILCADNGSTAYFLDTETNGGDLTFDLELFDWQSSYNPSGVAGEIGSIIAESPTLLDDYPDGMIDITDDWKMNAAPSTENSSVATIEITNVTPSDIGNQYMFLTVTSDNPDNYGNPFGAPYPDELELAAYYLWEAPISDQMLNVPPYVGQVTGPSSVDSTMPVQNYYADSIYDPDLGQTLSAMWSVVPTGNAPVYNIASNPDLSVDIDWDAGYTPEQTYDVNIRVSDGFAQVEGTLLSVGFYNTNTDPTVGAVSGPNPVTVGDTSASYTAPISDPDVWQTLTVTWSVVPTGDPANYSIAAEADDSLDQDWSTYEVGDYDVNVEVNDGIATVEGTLLTVSLNNTAPTLGDITGSASVDETDTASLYNHGSLTDPDNGQTHTYMWSVVPDGDPASFVIAPNAASDGLEVNWCSYPIGEYDIQVQVYDGYDYGTSAVFDVVRGLSTCTGDAHAYTGSHGTWPTFSYTGYTPSGWPAPPPSPPILDFYMLPRMDMDFFASGDFAGQGVIQAGSEVLMNFTADTTGMADPSTSYEWKLPGSSFWSSTWDVSPPCSGRVATSIDTSPDLDSSDGYSDNRIVVVTSHHHQNIYVLDADSTTPTSCLMTTLTDLTGASGASLIKCIAIDKDDDIWALAFHTDSNWRLHHWTYILDDNTGGPYYTYESADTLLLTTELSANNDVYDMVASFLNDHLYIFEGGANGRGELHEVDLTTSPPTYDGNQTNLFQSTIDSSLIWNFLDDSVSGSTPIPYPYGADIMIDHVFNSVCDPEHCRIEVMARLSTGNTHMTRMDLEMNVMDQEDTGSEQKMLLCAGLSTDSTEGERVIVCPMFADNSMDPAYEFYFWAPSVTW